MAESVPDHRQGRSWIGQLPAHHHHQGKAEEQKDQPADAVPDADNFVVGGENVFPPKTEFVMFVFVPMLVLVVVMGFLRMRRSVHAKKIYRIKY